MGDSSRHANDFSADEIEDMESSSAGFVVYFFKFYYSNTVKYFSK